MHIVEQVDREGGRGVAEGVFGGLGGVYGVLVGDREARAGMGTKGDVG